MAKEHPPTPFQKLPPRVQEQLRTAREIAHARVWAERWEAKGNTKRAADRRAEEPSILRNCKNFKMLLPTEEQIVTAMAAIRSEIEKDERRRAEEEAELSANGE
jgi:hypothetical protein